MACLWSKFERFQSNQKSAQRRREHLAIEEQSRLLDPDLYNRGPDPDLDEEMETPGFQPPYYDSSQLPYGELRYAPTAPMFTPTMIASPPRGLMQQTLEERSDLTAARPAHNTASQSSRKSSDLYAIDSSTSSSLPSLSELSPDRENGNSDSRSNQHATSSRKRVYYSSDGSWSPPSKAPRTKTASGQPMNVKSKPLATRKRLVVVLKLPPQKPAAPSQGAESTSNAPSRQTSSKRPSSQNLPNSAREYSPVVRRNTRHTNVEDDHEDAVSTGMPRTSARSIARAEDAAAWDSAPIDVDERADALGAGAKDRDYTSMDKPNEPERHVSRGESARAAAQEDEEVVTSSGNACRELGASNTSVPPRSVLDRATPSTIAKNIIDEVQQQSRERVVDGSSNVSRSSNKGTQRDDPPRVIDPSTDRVEADTPTIPIHNTTALSAVVADDVNNAAHSMHERSTTSPLQNGIADGTHATSGADEVPNAPIDDLSTNNDPQPQPAQPAQPMTVLHRADALIYWDSTTKSPDVFDLTNPGTNADLFAQLDRYLPKKFGPRQIISVSFSLVNKDKARLENTTFPRILAENGDKGFEYLSRMLGQYSREARPVLDLEVEFAD